MALPLRRTTGTSPSGSTARSSTRRTTATLEAGHPVLPERARRGCDADYDYASRPQAVQGRGAVGAADRQDRQADDHPARHARHAAADRDRLRRLRPDDRPRRAAAPAPLLPDRRTAPTSTASTTTYPDQLRPLLPCARRRSPADLLGDPRTAPPADQTRRPAARHRRGEHLSPAGRDLLGRRARRRPYVTAEELAAHRLRENHEPGESTADRPREDPCTSGRTNRPGTTSTTWSHGHARPEEGGSAARRAARPSAQPAGRRARPGHELRRGA